MRAVYLFLGVVFLILAVIGLALPVIPQVPFFIISAAFFARGSEKARRKIVESELYKKHLRRFALKYDKFLGFLEEPCV